LRRGRIGELTEGAYRPYAQVDEAAGHRKLELGELD